MAPALPRPPRGRYGIVGDPVQCGQDLPENNPTAPHHRTQPELDLGHGTATAGNPRSESRSGVAPVDTGPVSMSSVSSLRPYPAYMESGLDWLGRVPDHWEVRRLKGVAKILSGATSASGRSE